jgi:hypothetical protein
MLDADERKLQKTVEAFEGLDVAVIAPADVRQRADGKPQAALRRALAGDEVVGQRTRAGANSGTRACGRPKAWAPSSSGSR